jgi:hypothetical protein
MRHISVWVVEFIKLLGVKLLGGRRLHPIATQCPICQQMVRLHVNKAGRRHVFAHARGLYEGSRFDATAPAPRPCSILARTNIKVSTCPARSLTSHELMAGIGKLK